jgi:hypothetical protein
VHTPTDQLPDFSKLYLLNIPWMAPHTTQPTNRTRIAGAIGFQIKPYLALEEDADVRSP